LYAANIISMPDKWEYPWFAAWDLAFHCVPLARVDADFAKRQLEILLREYYMHPNGQIPAYEWNFSDVNPPVHGWATWKVYEIDREQNNGVGDIEFLEKIFHKLLLNFTWWVNQKTIPVTTFSVVAFSGWIISVFLTGLPQCLLAESCNRPMRPAGWRCTR
jgi:hypothetical protein